MCGGLAWAVRGKGTPVCRYGLDPAAGRDRVVTSYASGTSPVRATCPYQWALALGTRAMVA